MLTFIARRFGEDTIEEAFARVLEPYLEERYRPFDVRERPYEETLYRNLYLSFEAMRGHLVGPDRNGDMEVDEYEDRFVISFDPCGSGGRQQRGDPVEGTPLARRAAVRLRRHRGGARLGLEREGRLLLLRALLLRARVLAGEALGPSAARRSTRRSIRTRRAVPSRRNARGRSTRRSTRSRPRRTSGSA